MTGTGEPALDAATAGRLLAMLQLADSALPVGRFVFSHGLEQWLREHPDAPPEAVAGLVATTVCEGIAPLNGVVLAHAHRARSVAELTALDDLLTAHTTTPAARKASEACGRQLAALAPHLADGALLEAYCALAGQRETRGNLAVVEGVVGQALGLPAEAAVLVSLREGAVSLLSAALRLGALAPSQAQAIQADLRPTIAAAAATAVRLGLDELSCTAPELEACALGHARADVRMFAT